jgi:plasmid stabilization system protein ParE
MAFKIAISERAEKNLDEIVVYLENEWSVRVRDKYLSIVKKKVELISQNPFSYPSSVKRKNIHRCVLTKHSILYFRIKDDEIEVITIQDARRDPKSLKL